MYRSKTAGLIPSQKILDAVKNRRKSKKEGFSARPKIAEKRAPQSSQSSL